MFDRWQEARADRAKELDLIPVMNLMVTLIPFLMLGAAFYHLGVVPISLPTRVEQPSMKPESDVVVTMQLLIERHQMTLSASSAQLEPADLLTLKSVLPNTGDAYDIAGLRERLVAVKGRYPKSDTIVVFPDDMVRYQPLVEILDGTRERKVGERDGEDVREPLFPVTVFSRPPVPEPDVPEPDAPEAPDEPGATP